MSIGLSTELSTNVSISLYSNMYICLSTEMSRGLSTEMSTGLSNELSTSLSTKRSIICLKKVYCSDSLLVCFLNPNRICFGFLGPPFAKNDFTP